MSLLQRDRLMPLIDSQRLPSSEVASAPVESACADRHAVLVLRDGGGLAAVPDRHACLFLGVSEQVRTKTPLSHFLLILKSSDRTQSSCFSLWTIM